jgi:hypothetical protein
MRSIKEPVVKNGKILRGSFTYSKYFCPVSERKIRTSYLPETQEKVLIVDCMNGDKEITRDKLIIN